MTIAAPTLADLTSATLGGNGIFDVLMRANKAHLDEQYEKGRIKGTEYATVYLGSLEHVLSAAVQFLLTKDKIGLDAQLAEQQILLAQVEVSKANAQLAQITAQTELITEQKQSEALRNFIHPSDPTQSGSIEQERHVLIAQECKLKAEFDVLQESKLKSAQETQLLTWKVVTEKAQTSAVGVEDNSVVGKQKLLYAAQTGGFVRDAEQKAAKILVDSWNVRRTTDETGTQGNSTNVLDDSGVGRAVLKLLQGVGA